MAGCLTQRKNSMRVILSGATTIFFVALLLSPLSDKTHAERSSARSVKVIDSILGVRIGSTLAEARSKLKGLGTLGGQEEKKGEGEAQSEPEEKLEGVRKEAWALKKTDYAYIVYRTDLQGRVIWVSGFVRPGREIPFKKLGDINQATAKTDSQIAWTVEQPGGGYRLVAKGPSGKARIVYLFSLAAGRANP
jgi:hypothetical protein